MLVPKGCGDIAELLGPDPLVGVRFPAEVLALLDRYAETENVSRSEAIRELVRKGLGRGTN